MKTRLLITLLISSIYSFGQLSGSLKLHANQHIRLLGYIGFETIELATTTIDASGNFNLVYTDYKGMGYLETSDNSMLFLVLNEPQINITGTHLKEHENIRFTTSKENQLFNQYVIEHNQRERVLSGWKYLLPQYKEVELLKQQKEYINVIQKEIERLENQDIEFLNNLKSSYYVSWFLPLRKMLDDISLSAKQYTHRIPGHIADFRSLNFNESKLYNSGIIDDLIESHYWLLENGGMNTDTMYIEMNATTDYLIENLEGNDTLLNAVSSFLYSLLEKSSLHGASEHLALKLLTQSSCTINDDLVKQMETYRIMKVGKTAPDILFAGKKMVMGSEVNVDLKLSDLNSPYTLVVFGASWCSKCATEIPQIKEKYIAWKLKGVETVFVSLDNEEAEFSNFVKDFPFLSTCDFKSWENQAAQDYYVFAAPTLFLLNKEREIILRPSSIEQVDAWVKLKLGPKN